MPSKHIKSANKWWNREIWAIRLWN